MPFQPKDFVRLISNPERAGVVTAAGCRERSGILRCQIQFTDGAVTWIQTELIEHVPAAADPIRDFRDGRLSGPESLRRILLHDKLSGRLAGVLYSMEATETRFLPYQFKPVLKLIESPCNGLLVADEVGLGKTIEAGLIWTELRARAGAQRLLVVCPAKLKIKWVRELSRRFGVRAEEASAAEVLHHMQEFRRNGSHHFALVSSYQSLRPPSDWEDTDPKSDTRTALAHFLNDNAQSEPVLDLLVMDEAHYMRNSETKTFALGQLTTDIAGHRVFLSATPLHTSNRNLYSLLRLLDPDTFSSEATFQGILEANAPLVRLRDALARPDTTAAEALEHVADAADNSYLDQSEMLANLKQALGVAGALDTPSKRVALAYQSERINLLGHAFSRTRKRDVFTKEERVVRNVASRKIAMTPLERSVYETVCNLAVEFADTNMLPSGFLDVTPQRLVSSSVVAALEHWIGRGAGRISDDVEDAVESRPMVDFFRGRLTGRFDLPTLERLDTKFQLLIDELNSYWAVHPGKKVILFTTFHPTINYLSRRLQASKIDVLTIKGGAKTPAQDVIQQFEKPGSPLLLLSTEVGGEGLDMQFASALINYDLPWNPMVVEQRIGRIDRIGQEERQILVLNLLQEGTIDERINDRLYVRLDLFRNSIGDLEAVVGPVLDKMQRALLSHRLSPEQQTRVIVEAELAIAAEQQERERLEERAAVFAAYGDYLLNQIRAKHDQEQWVTSAEIEHYVCDYFLNQAPACQLRGRDPQDRIYDIQLDIETYAELERFLELNNLRGQTAICSSSVRRIRFDHRVYSKGQAGVELVSQSHALVRFVSDQIRQRRLAVCVPVAVKVQLADAGRVPRGTYFFNLQRWAVTGLRQIERLRYDVATLDGEQLDEAQAETLVETAARSGARWLDWENEAPSSPALVALDALDDVASDAFIQYEARCTSENNDRARVQLTSLERFKERRTAVLAGLIDRYDREGKRPLKAASEGQLAKLAERCAIQSSKIRQKAAIEAEYTRLCFGLINVE